MKRLLMLLAVLSSGCRGPQPSAPPSTMEVFREIPIEFVHKNGASGKFYMTEIMGSGAAVLDYDNDGDLDIVLVQSAGESKLFRNELVPSGTLRFTDATEGSKLRFHWYGMGAATGDYNNDGFTDLLITGYDARALFRNNGDGTFTEIPFPQPPGVWSTSASFFDYDLDGRLDLVILSYVNFSERANKSCRAPTGEPDYCTPRAYSPVSARLYHNDGGDRFSDVTARSGINGALGPGLGVAAADLNDDGWPDLYVANDTAQNHVWINQRNGSFKEQGLEAGAAYSEDGLPKAGMGVAIGDADEDGLEDVFVVNLMREGATLYRKASVTPEGLPSFFDVTRQSGLYQITLPFTGFGTEWIDYDNDGRLDLFVANGAVTLREEQRGKPEPFKERNLLIHNEGNGKFKDVTAESGTAMQHVEISRGLAAGDLNNDGTLDLVITNNNGPARILVNSLAKRNWIQVRTEGGGTVNRDGIGAQVTVRPRGGRSLAGRVHTDSSYCSARDPRVHFGLGDRQEPVDIEVQWPGGRRERWPSVPVNRVVTLRWGTGETH